jgi:hypothetical protein
MQWCRLSNPVTVRRPLHLAFYVAAMREATGVVASGPSTTTDESNGLSPIWDPLCSEGGTLSQSQRARRKLDVILEREVLPLGPVIATPMGDPRASASCASGPNR